MAVAPLVPASWLSALALASLPGRASAEGYSPLLSLETEELELSAPVLLFAGGVGGGAFVVDRAGDELAGGAAFSPRLRVGLTVQSERLVREVLLRFEYEHDLIGGTLAGRPALAGEDLPLGGEPVTVPRKASLLVSSGVTHLLAGLTTSHAGLGLVANDGGQGWEPWAAPFHDPRAADRVLRLALALGPVSDRELFFTLAGDHVLADDSLEDGDAAWQGTARAELGKGRRSNAGLSATYRRQQGELGQRLEVAILDATGVLALGSAELGLELAAEAALILGTAGVAPTPEHPTQAVRQAGAALRARGYSGPWALHLDVVLASGDRDSSDDLQSAFRADSSFGLGLVLFPRVLAAQSGHALATAGDPALLGQPAVGLERFPSRGAVSNTWAAFPRLAWAPLPGLEISGGALFAFALALPMDPLNTRLAGGTARNALDAAPGRYYGTELDLALRYTTLLGASELVAGLEGGVLLPGSALALPGGGLLAPVPAGRALLQLRL